MRNFQLLFLLGIALTGCHLTGDSLLREKYLLMLEEVHRMECEHLQKAGVTPADTSLSEFRSTALKYILINPNHDILGHYEEINQSLARMQDTLDDAQLHSYFETMRKVYSNPCR